MKNKNIHKYTIEFSESFWQNLVEVAGHGNVKQFIIQSLKVALEAHTINSLILCGGRGTSFRPISVATPAVMLPIGYKPILEYAIDLLQKHALTDIFLSVGYLKEHIQQQFSEKKFPGVTLSFIAEDKPLDTAGAVLNARKLFKSTFMVLNGDLITNLNLSLMLEHHRRVVKEGGIATMFILENQGNGQIELEESKKQLTRFVESGKKVYPILMQVFMLLNPKFLIISKKKYPH